MFGVHLSAADAGPAGQTVGGPITEVGGGGPTFPQQAVNDVWGLSSSRATCTVCHQVEPGTSNVVAAVFAKPFNFNEFGAAYRKILFEQAAPGSDDIFDPTQRQREAATRWPALLQADSDRDGYSNGVELRFGSLPGNANNHPSRPASQLGRWNTILTRELRGKQVAKLELDPRVRRAGPDADRDRVPDLLERFAGFDPKNAKSSPLVAARRLAVYRQLLLEAGVPQSALENA
jgi:hypothetical protein